MKRLVIVLAALASLCGSGYSFYYFFFRSYNYDQYSIWVMLGVPVGLLILAAVLASWAASDNLYNVKAGQVIGRCFTAAHMVPATYVPGTHPIYVPPQWVEDDWALKIKAENGRTGVLHFGTNVFGAYTVGEWYPKRQPTQ